MDYKQKYESALERARKLGTREMPIDPTHSIQEQIFPELRESEDENVKNTLIDLFKNRLTYYGTEKLKDLKVNDIVSWLEKQGEQKSWSEKDEKWLKEAISIITQYDIICRKEGDKCYTSDSVLDWLKSLKDRVQPKPKQDEQKPAWSEEDEKMLNSLLQQLIRIAATSRTDSTSINYTFAREINWLKSLKPQPRWKPSEEQMEAIRIAAEVGTANNSWAMVKMKEMYEQLQSL